MPEDIAIVGAGNDEMLCELSRPTISSVALPAEEVGYEAAALLDKLIRGDKGPRRRILLPAAEVATRQSTDILAVSDPDLERAIRYLRQHVCEPITVDDVLPHACMERRSFERRFRAAVGHSPAQEFRRMRIEAAKSILNTNREMKIELVAQKCGFADGSSFATAFRHVTHMTPTAYRKGETQPKPRRR
jgi:LacI family transcriptional regulator